MKDQKEVIRIKQFEVPVTMVMIYLDLKAMTSG